MATQTETINIIVREDGSRVVKRNLEDVGGAAEKAGNLLGKFKTLLAGVAGGVVVNQLRELADQYTNIQNRLRLTTTDQANLNAVFNELQAISSRTRSALEANVELYSRMSVSAKDLGLSQKDVLEFTESLNQAIKISGATANEAEAGIRQLSQGLASGALRGDELNSVLENLPAVADVIAKSLGVTRGELRQMGADGKITANTIVTAFSEARGELAEKFAKTVPTAAEGFVLLKNQLIETVGELDKAVGGSTTLGGALQGLTNWLKQATPEIVNFGRAIVGTLDPTDEMSDGTKILATVLITLYGVLKGIGTLLLGTVVIAFQTVGKTIGAVAAAVATLVQGGTIQEAWNVLKEGAVDVKDTYVQTTNEMADSAINTTSEMFTKLAQVWDKGQRSIQDRSAQTVGVVSDERGTNNTNVGPSEKELEKQRKALERLQNQLRGVLSDIAPLDAATLEYAKSQETLALAFQKGLITVDQFNRYTQVLNAQYRAQLDPLAQLNRELDEQFHLLSMNAQAREIEAQVMAAQKQLLSEGIILTEQETQALRDRFTTLQETSRIVQAQDDLLAQSVEQRRGFTDQLIAIQNLLADPTSGFTQGDATAALEQLLPTGLLEGTQEMLNAQLEQFQLYYDQIEMLRQGDLVSEQTANQMRAKIDQQIMDLRLQNAKSFFGNLATLSRSENSKLAKIGQAAALAQATIDAASAIMKTYSSAPYPYNIGLAAAQAAASAVQIAQIAGAGTSFQTGGSFTVGGSGGTDSQMVAFRATPGEKVAISNKNALRKGDPAGHGGAVGTGEPVQIAGPTIINVRDPKEIPNAIQSSDGRDAIINVFSDNINTFRQMLQSS